MNKAADRTIDSVYPKYRTEADWRENTEAILSQAVEKMFSGNAKKPSKPGIVPNNKHELNKHELVPYHKTRDFRKKIAQLYVPVLQGHADKANGRFPVFKVAKNAFDKIPSSANSQRVKKVRQTVNI